MTEIQETIKAFLTDENLVRVYQEYRLIWQQLAFDNEFSASYLKDIEDWLEKYDRAPVAFSAEDFSIFVAARACRTELFREF